MKKQITAKDAALIDLCLASYGIKASEWLSYVETHIPHILGNAIGILRENQLEELTISKFIYLLLQVVMKHTCQYYDATEENWLDILSYITKTKFTIKWLSQQQVLKMLYLLNCLSPNFGCVYPRTAELAEAVFGEVAWNQTVETIKNKLVAMGYSDKVLFETALAVLCLANHSLDISNISPELISQMQTIDVSRNTYYKRIALALHNLGDSDYSICFKFNYGELRPETIENIAKPWLEILGDWRDISPYSYKTRAQISNYVLQAGRWLYQKHPDIEHPQQWSRELSLEFIRDTDNQKYGEWAAQGKMSEKPVSERFKVTKINCLRLYFQDLQKWELIERKFNPKSSLAVPKHILEGIGPNPRAIDKNVWLKLFAAAFNLTEADYMAYMKRKEVRDNQGFRISYPIELFRAAAALWLFAALRPNELRHLPLDCITWEKVQSKDGNETQEKKVCMLRYFSSKTSKEGIKPVHEIVGYLIETWKEMRPEQSATVSSPLGETSFLFMYRGKLIGQDFLNKSLIPLLCFKAGIEKKDASGVITAHRARATIATELAELNMDYKHIQQYLNHDSPDSTLYYIKVSTASLVKAYSDARNSENNIRSISVLIDQAAVRKGDAASNSPWIYYKLGHGYCTYSFFSKCPHRMACKKCSFYRPKESSLVQELESKEYLMHAIQTIELTEIELELLKADLVTVEKLLKKFFNLPTPDQESSNGIL